jgi:hypothetical protein
MTQTILVTGESMYLTTGPLSPTVPAGSNTMRYINDLENLTKGKYQGENLYEVAEEEPSYLHNLLKNASLDMTDRELICGALGLPSDYEPKED